MTKAREDRTAAGLELTGGAFSTLIAAADLFQDVRRAQSQAKVGQQAPACVQRCPRRKPTTTIAARPGFQACGGPSAGTSALVFRACTATHAHTTRS